MARFAAHYFLLFAVMATVFPYFQLLLKAMGFSPSEIGLLQGMMGFAGVAGPILTGLVADLVGTRRYTLGACLMLFVLLLPVLTGTEALLPAMAVAALLGLCVRSIIPLTDALVSGELSDPVHQYGRVRVWGSIGFVVVLVLVRVFNLTDECSARSIAVSMIVAAGVCMLSALTLPERPAQKSPDGAARRGRAEFRRVGIFLVFLVPAALHQFGMAAHYSFFTLYLQEELGLASAAWVWAIGTTAEIPVLFLGGRIIRRFGISSMLVAASAAVSVRLGVYALAPPLWAIMSVQLLHGVIFGLYHAACIEFIRRTVPARFRGLGMALYMSLAVALPNLAGSALGGVIIERWGYSALFGSYSIAPLIGVGVLLCAFRRLDATGRPDAAG